MNVNNVVAMSVMNTIIWGLVIYSVVTVLKRLTDISRSVRNIEAKLTGDKSPDSPPADENAG